MTEKIFLAGLEGQSEEDVTYILNLCDTLKLVPMKEDTTLQISKIRENFETLMYCKYAYFFPNNLTMYQNVFETYRQIIDDLKIEVWSYQKITDEAIKVLQVNPPATPGPGEGSGTTVNFKICDVAFDGINTTFLLPIDVGSVFLVFVNGLYQSEIHDYTLDLSENAKKITFLDVFEAADICRIIYIQES